MCVNTNGSYYCECQTGYRLKSDNISCKGKWKLHTLFDLSYWLCDNIFYINYIKYIFIILDVDECTENRHNCSNLEECQNTVGGFQCNCKPGYQRNNTTGNCEGRDSNIYSVTVWIMCLYLKLIIVT